MPGDDAGGVGAGAAGALRCALAKSAGTMGCDAGPGLVGRMRVGKEAFGCDGLGGEAALGGSMRW
jgi:hypothetical protein